MNCATNLSQKNANNRHVLTCATLCISTEITVSGSEFSLCAKLRKKGARHVLNETIQSERIGNGNVGIEHFNSWSVVVFPWC